MTNKNTMTKDLTSLRGRVAKLPSMIEAMMQKIHDVEVRMAALKKAGLIYAKPHWRGQKYFLLVHPMVNGTRPKPTYIGTDPDKIKAATDGIARAEEYDKLDALAKGFSGHVYEAARALGDLERALR